MLVTNDRRLIRRSIPPTQLYRSDKIQMANLKDDDDILALLNGIHRSNELRSYHRFHPHTSSSYHSPEGTLFLDENGLPTDRWITIHFPLT
jgi:hypothetical protein